MWLSCEQPNGTRRPSKTEEFLFSKTDIDAATVQAYLDTEYRVQCDTPFALQIGTINDALLSIYKSYQVDCCAFLTACNPFSQIVSATDNSIRQCQLADELAIRGLTYLPGIGQHPSNNWPGEESFLVLNLNLQAAKKIGEQFGQNAIVWCGAAGLPELILLR
jgi:hypothetical protein